MTPAALDVLLAAALVLIGARCLAVRDLRTAALLFIVFGLLLALAWVRLAAPDVALAEAAIGAGVTGALLLDAAAQLQPGAAPAHTRTAAPLRFGVVALAAALGLLLAATLFALPPSPGEATRAAAERLRESGVAHPVTAVLLAFRAYDTLLEIAVLFAAVIAAAALPPPTDVRPLPPPEPLLAHVVRVTLPIALLVAVYLLWAGATRTGGAFQGGAVLAGALLLARFVGVHFDVFAAPAGQRALLGGGLAVFVAVGASGAAAAGALLAYPAAWAGALILMIETALTVSIALSLVALFGRARGG